MFACQSISSLRHGLAHGSGNRTSAVAAVSMLVANTANKLFFRSTDPEVRAFVEELWPQNPGDPSAVAVRPLSTLRAGECYAVTADGRFERCQLDPLRLGRVRDGEHQHRRRGRVPCWRCG